MQTIRSVLLRGILAILILGPTAVYGDVPPAVEPSPAIKVVVRAFDRLGELQSLAGEFDGALQALDAKNRQCAGLQDSAREACTVEAAAAKARAQTLLERMSAVLVEIEAEARDASGLLSAADAARVDRILATARELRDSRTVALRERSSDA